jgi:hypothetical protein
MQVTPGEAGLIEGQQCLRRDQLTLEGAALGIASIAPMDSSGLREAGDFVDPGGHVATQGG